MAEQLQTGDYLQVVERIGIVPVKVTLLGTFRMGFAGMNAGPWPRPPAKRLCELLMLRPGHRLHKEVACESLFANLSPKASANALRKAASMARQALAPLGEVGPRLVRTSRDHIWVPADIPLEIDAVAHEAALRIALGMKPGVGRDAALSVALRQSTVLLDDEPYSDWALEPRDALERLRQRARLELARDRTKGHGRSQPDAVIDAWESCFTHDPASEEAAANLMACYATLGQRQLVVRTYRRCRLGLDDLDLRPSSSLERAYHRATEEASDFGTLIAYGH